MYFLFLFGERKKNRLNDFLTIFSAAIDFIAQPTDLTSRFYYSSCFR